MGVNPERSWCRGAGALEQWSRWKYVFILFLWRSASRQDRSSLLGKVVGHSTNIVSLLNAVFSQVQLRVDSKPAKEFKFHPLGSLGAISSISHDIQTRRKVMLEDGLSSPSHVGKDGLPGVPPEEFGCWPSWIIDEVLVQEPAGNLRRIRLKADNLVIIPEPSEMEI